MWKRRRFKFTDTDALCELVSPYDYSSEQVDGMQCWGKSTTKLFVWCPITVSQDDDQTIQFERIRFRCTKRPNVTYTQRFHRRGSSKESWGVLQLVSKVNINTEQECIPVGCVPSAARGLSTTPLPLWRLWKHNLAATTLRTVKMMHVDYHFPVITGKWREEFRGWIACSVLCEVPIP